MLRLLLLGCALTGCVAHVSLPSLPSPTAPEAERVAMLRGLTPVSVQETAPQLSLYYARPQPSFLLLRSGLRVMDPVDLLPAVEESSPTARFAHAFEAASFKANVAVSVALVMVLAGAVLDGAAIGTIGSSNRGLLPLLGAGTSTLLGSLIPLAVGMVFGTQAGLEKQSAFLMYPHDLRARLALPDEAAPSLPPPSPELLPALSP